MYAEVCASFGDTCTFTGQTTQVGKTMQRSEVTVTPEGTSVSNTPTHNKSKEGEADRWGAGNVVLCVEGVDLACYIKYACDICISGLFHRGILKVEWG